MFILQDVFHDLRDLTHYKCHITKQCFGSQSLYWSFRMVSNVIPT